MQKKALITGITGQDGSYLAELLLSKGYEVHGIVRRIALEDRHQRLWRIRDLLNDITLHAASLESYASLVDIINKLKPHEIYHLAAQSYVAYSFEDAYSTMNINVNGTHYVLSAIKNFSPKSKFYFAGSSEMFGKTKETPQNEKTSFHPRSPYGISKVSGFDLTRNYRESYNTFASSGILFNHESPRRGYEFVTRKISNAVAKIKLGKQKKLNLGNIKSYRDWGHARDYVEAMWLMLQQEQPSDFVIGTGKHYTVEDFAETAFSHVNLNYKEYIELDEKLVRPAEVDTLLADYTKAKKILNWEPKIHFKELVIDMVDSDLKLAKADFSLPPSISTKETSYIKERITLRNKELSTENIFSILEKKFEISKEKYFYPLKDSSFRNEDLIEAIKIIMTRRLTMSKTTEKFESTFKNKINAKYALMLNSGSSANLLAIQCLINPYRKKKLKPGDEVLVPVLCWSTTLWPIVQSGLKPVFVDVDVNTFNISLKNLVSKITKKTKAIMLVHVLGNSTNMDELSKIVKKHRLILIEDTCESLGSKFGNKYLGTIGDISTYSFYYSHQISSIEGGMICCKTKEDFDIIKSLRSHGWSKGLTNQRKFEKKNKHINKNFLFVNSGFNLRPTEIQAAIGISQFKSLNFFITQRNKNRNLIMKSLKNDKRWNNQVQFLSENSKVRASWFGISMLIHPMYKDKLKQILKSLDRSGLGIENRPIISGNITKQPSVKKYNLLKKKVKFNNADIIHKYGFFIGLKTNKIEKTELEKFKDIFFNAFKKI